MGWAVIKFVSPSSGVTDDLHVEEDKIEKKVLG